MGTWLRRVAGRLLPTQARRFLELGTLALQAPSPPALIRPPAAGSVLVLAPHPDDEAAGCGGSLCLHAGAGATITVAYLTDGRLGLRGLWDGSIPAAERPRVQAELVARRRAEAEAAAELLGVANLVFLEAPDGALGATPGLVDQLAALVRRIRPEILYAPFPADRQADHVAAARLLARVVGAGGVDGEIFAYEVWSPLYPNCMVEITAVAERKREALRRFASQVAENDYPHSILGLNAYRAMFHLQSRGYAEAFHRSSPAGYRRLCRLLVGEAD